MEVTTRLTRSDFFLLYLYLFPHLKGNWIFFVLLWIGLVSLHFARLAVPPSVPQAMVQIIDYGTAAFAATTAIFLWGVTWIMMMPGATGRVLGDHHYSISDDGFGEKSGGDESFTPWSGIARIRRVGPYLHIRIDSRLFHVIPKKSFPTSEAYRDFADALIVKWKSRVNQKTRNNPD